MDSTKKTTRGRYGPHKATISSKANFPAVSINLSDIDCNEALPDRIVSLSYPHFSIAVGRGSQSDETIEPRPDNAWFSSRVMSRQHATIRADAETRILTIQDDGSMHGTSLNGLRVGKEPLELLPADILTFGAEVVRGEETYQPLKISIYFEWEDEEISQAKVDQTSTGTRNKFTVDMSDEDFDSEMDDDDDLQVVSSSIREPSVEILSSAVYKPQPSQSDIKDSQPAPVVTVTSTTHVSDATGDANARSEPAKAPLDEAVEDEGDEEEDSDDELTRIKVFASKLPPFQEYVAHTEDVGEELEYDSDFPEESFFDDTDEENMGTKAKDNVLFSQSAPPKDPSSLSSDNIGREPSPSDAALARPRVSVSDLDMTTLAQTAATPIPPPPSAQKTYTPSYSNGYYQSNRYVPPLGYFDNLNRPSNSFVHPSAYDPQRPMGHINSYPTNPWNLWKSNSLGYANQQPPPPPPRPMNQYGQSNKTVPNPMIFNPFSENADTQSPQSVLTSSFDSLRGQKRKADAISECSDDEYVASSSVDKSAVIDALESSSPAITSSSPATNLSPMSVKTDKLPAVNNNGSGDDDGQASQTHEPSTDELDQILGDLLERHEAPSFGFQDMVDVYEHAEPAQEPARKKVKGNNGESTAGRSRAATALKYTVTALAGVTIGALGTVVGLASLPVDYFV